MIKKGQRFSVTLLWLKVTGGVLLFVASAVVWRIQVLGTPLDAASASPLDILHARCVQDMVANTCKVMGMGSTATTAKPSDLVFVAGIGAIEAVAYQQLYAAGDAMCSVVRSACAEKWDSGQCKTARTLYRL
jgi:hypothetical protein